MGSPSFNIMNRRRPARVSFAFPHSSALGECELRPHTGTIEKPEVLEAHRARIAAALEPV